MKKLTEILNGNLRDYRPVPFWSWNDDLEPDELVRQIRDMKDKGIGGFFMHARGGLKTEYLGDKWFECVKACIEESKVSDMNAWSYDENGWPSGFAGMKLLEDPANHENYLGREVTQSFDEKADAVYFLDGTTLKRVYEPCGEGTYVNVTVLTNPSVVDILDKNIVKKFINLTHEVYYKECGDDFGKFMKGFFTDEPQYYRWDTAYSKVLIPYFKEEYGIDLWDEVGKLFIDCDGAYAFRYKYFNALHKFFIESFAKQIYDWCEEHNCQLTGHAVEESAMYMQMWCCGGVMDFYEFEHMPGIDCLGRGIVSDLMPKQIGSASEQLGKKHVMTETFACCGWDVTPAELKRIAEWQYVSGVNLMCTHLSPYSIRGQRKRDYPLHYSEHNSWHEKFRLFNDYFSRLGYILAESKNRVNTLIVHPIKTAYLTYDRRNDYNSVLELDETFRDLIGEYGALNIPHHYGDENLMSRHASVKNGKLKMGNYEYEYVVMPWIKTIDKSTYALLKEFIAQGGKLVFESGKPEYLEGEPYSFDDLVQTATREDILKNLEYSVETDSRMVRSAYRTGDFGTFLYVVNLEEKNAVDCKIKLNSKYPVLYDLQTMEVKPLNVNNGVIDLHLDYAGSAIIFESDEPYTFNSCNENGKIDLSGEWKVVSSTDNSLTIDKAQVSLDGVNYGEKAYVLAIFNDLINKQYLGKIYLKYEFNVRDIPERIYLESEQMSILGCKVNGNEIKFDGQGTLDKSFISSDLKPFVKQGVNEIIYEIEFYQSEHVYFVLSDVTPEKESLKNCLSYDTELESIYVRGDFGVYDDNLKEEENVFLSEGDYYISYPQKTVVAKDFTRQGYLFFAGKLFIEKDIVIEKGASILETTGRKAVVEVFVDGKFVKTLMFENKVDLIDFADGKTHTVKLVVYASNRNIYGPHHFVEYEPLGVSPWTFDLTGSWDGYKCDAYRENYSFVKFSLIKD